MRVRQVLVAVTLAATLTAAACGEDAEDAPTPTPTASATEDHSGHSVADGEHFDAMFIDGMIEHHEGAIAMAEQALDESERPEIRELAQAILDAQASEIDQIESWREDWFAGLPHTGGMAMDMGPMEVAGDASQPFDQRFIDAMIPHHEGAISMAREALENSSRPEIRAMADEVIRVQQEEIDQMREWRAQWFE